MTHPLHSQSSLVFKGASFTFTVIQLKNQNLYQIEKELIHKLQQAPQFFHQAPIVIDLQDCPATSYPDFVGLKDLLEKHHLCPIGLRNYAASWSEPAQEAGFVLLPKGSSLQTQNEQTPTKVIVQPVRSGQQIYARGGDLLVIGAVSAGSEILADGHIHVYGPLRGRALAGVNGNEEARIFCDSLEAELLSIAGHYFMHEQLKESFHKKVCLSLENQQLLLRAI
jgi:septum site-determining protein MinC